MDLVIGFVAGVTLCVWLAELPDWHWLLAGGLLAPAARWLPARTRWVFVVTAGVSLGLAWAVFHAGQRLALRLPAALDGQTVPLVLTVRDLPVRTERGFRLLAQVETPLAGIAWVRLHLTRGEPWPAGSRWRAQVRLRPVRASANPHGFDAEAWLWAQGIQASGQVVGQPQRLADAGDWLAQVDRLRARIAGRIGKVLGTTREAALITALTVGMQQGIGREEWQWFARTGVTHLVSISGLHVGMVAGLAVLALRALFRRWPPRWGAPRAWIAMGGLAAAGAYSLLAGWSVPTRRTFFMLAVACLLLCWRRALSPFHIWWLALGSVLLLDPFAVYFPGLWLSFGLVAALMLVSVGRRRAPKHWRGWLAGQWAASVMSVVPLIGFFAALPLISPLANLIAIPWISALVSPLCLLAAAVPVDALLHLADWLCRGFYLFIAGCAAAPIWFAPIPPWPLLALGLLGSLWLIAPLGWAGRLLGAALLLPMLWYAPPRPREGAFRAMVLDVGQGLSVWLSTARHDLLYDTGLPAAEAVVLPNLLAAGVRRLDALVLSHHDADHDGAAPAIIRALPVATLWVGQADSAHALGVAFRPCRPGRRWQWDGVRFEMLWPDAAWREPGNNAYSCVLRVSGEYGSLLLTGDISQNEEAALVARYGRALASTVLVAPHHGSRSSSSPVFLRMVAPRWGVVSAGWRNRYGHPHERVLGHYRAMGITLLRTDRQGAIMLDFTAPPRVTGYRQVAPRHWRPGSASDG
ncbi:MAG: DNA internalization-related competence protein ComEC/Rec2 [Paludibacterium sp.]|uniref:DNA internalization-related competence protein ComEC/Rec2 n=1 Tax=Paludibacterium sp. TaxID=1917523 RepID=UPI0025D8D914|nr:DNA internalization-related competence protein ComEC/Rec2 [Paludibacterium sp.]MBV8046029.1 DNA internalization-related competence protein ComEC/Rec2 [Paludibacterium sp.]MBV8645929.1 DNA internalization-related competence protein ComEC/Rec2 [Paludibacterium sp.]